MTIPANNFVESYLNWLKSNIKWKEINGFLEISTPFLDRHNDHLQIYVKEEGAKYILTDDGYVLNDLLMSGCDLSTPNRQNVLQTIINNLGVKVEGDNLIVEARPDNFPQKKHQLLQVMLSVNDMFMISQPRVASLFLEDVEQFLDENEIRYTPSVQFTGKSGFIHNFEFVIPASKKKAERLIKAINNPTRDKTQTILFAWSDIREARKKDSSLYVFINDNEHTLKPEVTGAFGEYGVITVPWTKREEFKDELAA